MYRNDGTRRTWREIFSWMVLLLSEVAATSVQEGSLRSKWCSQCQSQCMHCCHLVLRLNFVQPLLAQKKMKTKQVTTCTAILVHCRVLPPGDVTGMMSEPLLTDSESFMMVAVNVFL